MQRTRKARAKKFGLLGGRSGKLVASVEREFSRQTRAKNRLPHLGELSSAFRKIVVALIANDDATVRIKPPDPPSRTTLKRKSGPDFLMKPRRALIRAGLLFGRLFFGMFS